MIGARSAVYTRITAQQASALNAQMKLDRLPGEQQLLLYYTIPEQLQDALT
jgi:hypothetical protein